MKLIMEVCRVQSFMGNKNFAIFIVQYQLYLQSEMIIKMMRLLLIFGILFTITHSQSMELKIPGQISVMMVTQGQKNQSFFSNGKHLDCGMPQLYVMEDSQHSNYQIVTEGILIQSISSQWTQVQTNFQCDDKYNCIAEVNNNCGGQAIQINWIKLQTTVGDMEYLVNCDPNKFYKPFEWGLFLLIMLGTLVMTLSAKYSRAWSYGGYGFQIKKNVFMAFMVFMLGGTFMAYLFPSITSIVAQILGSILGGAGVMVCVSEILWLFNSKKFQIKIYKKMRVIDLISGSIGLLSIPLYWMLKGEWFVNDVMAVCTIVALMKILKIRSLSMGVLLLVALLALEGIVGVIVHYVLNISYNNYVINLFQNPIMLVMPSITPQLYRKCAWLPISAVLFPGLLISYLRRFDKSRATHLYFLIGLVSYYIGSVLWMVFDMQTVHALPFAIISEPVMIIIICVQSFRRNEFRILWTGTFYDEELTDTYESKSLGDSREFTLTTPSAYAQLVGSLKLQDRTQSEENYHVLE